MNNPLEGDVIQFFSDTWLIYDNGEWREMTVKEQETYD